MKLNWFAVGEIAGAIGVTLGAFGAHALKSRVTEDLRSFVLCVSEGNYDGVHTAFYDLFRVAKGKVVEHWDTTEKIASRSEWKNDNGKF